MERRKFLGKSLVGGTAIAVLSQLGDAAAKSVEAAPQVAAFELEEVTIAELQKGMASGKWSARGITEAYLRRIEMVDRQGPTLRSVIETNPDALAIAEELDRERRAGKVRGPLHGIPVLVKDNIDTHDRMTTTAGSLALEGSIPPADSGVAAKLRDAGAVLLGKANLSEWANIRSNHSSSGWSARGGQCRNPYVLDRNPCGSSSGSGAATSANLCAVAIGTETDGSIVCPSNACGLVGLKPTVGLVPGNGIIPISHSQDTAGPMARTVSDAAILLSAIAGADKPGAQADYTKSLDANGLKGARLGVLRSEFGFNPKVDKVLATALEDLKRLGAELIDPVTLPSGRDIGRNELTVLLYELKADLNAYLATLGPGARVKSLKEIIEFNEKNAEREMPWFGQDLFIEAEAKGPLTTKEYRDALKKNQQAMRGKGIDATMKKHRLDAILAPTGGPAWTTDWVNGDHFGGGSSSPAAIAGYPNITVPAGFVQGLPVGLSFFGRAWSEPTLLRLAYAYEQGTRHRKPPKFLPTLS
jgi:amidase